MDALSSNYFTDSSLVFEFRDDGNYNDLIMRMMNDIMDTIDNYTNQFEENTHYQ